MNQFFHHRNFFNILVFAAILPFANAAFGKDARVDALQFNSSPFDVCKNVGLLKKDDYQKNKAYWDRAINECGVDIQVLPDTGFFNTMISKLGQLDENKNSASFLKQVGERALSYVDINNKFTENLIHCARNDKTWFESQQAKASSKEEKNFYNYTK